MVVMSVLIGVDVDIVLVLIVTEQQDGVIRGNTD